jgi:threonine dehydratase
MTNGRYHHEVFLPVELASQFNALNVNLRYTSHARKEAVQDELGTVAEGQLPRHLAGSEWQLVGAEVKQGAVVSVIARKELDARRDLVMAVKFTDEPAGRARVATLWTNHRNDQHRGLRRWGYVTK